MDPFDRLGEVDATKQADPATPDGKSAVTLAAESARTLMGQSAESADDKQTAWFEKNMKGTSVVDDDAPNSRDVQGATDNFKTRFSSIVSTNHRNRR